MKIFYIAFSVFEHLFSVTQGTIQAERLVVLLLQTLISKSFSLSFNLSLCFTSKYVVDISSRFLSTKIILT